MMATDAERLPARLKELGIHPRREKGQNFLVSPAILHQIVETAQLAADDWVIEVGPGPGNLTSLLAGSAGRVIAVEVDPRFVALLQQELGRQTNVHIILGDVRRLSPQELLQTGGDATGSHPYKVVANLPYYLTSHVLRHFLEAPLPPQVIVVTVQWEVARRIVAEPPRLSLLSVAVQFYGTPEVIRKVSAGAFYPRPKVDSAVVRIRVIEEPDRPHPQPKRYFRVVAAGFAQRRKQLRNALSRGLGLGTVEVTSALEHAGISPTRRAESLNLAEWARLTDALPQPDDSGNSKPTGMG